jgi:hypothetical protein
MICLMSNNYKVILYGLMLACCSFLMVIPAYAFTANSLDITVNENGDAIATFHYTLEGIIENSIPQSVLEEELKKGLTTSSEPPELKSMDRSGAVLVMKKFADTYEVPTGTEYLTATLDFKKAEAALQNSALSSVVAADFSPEKIVLTFPDSYQREFSNVDVLPAVSHTVTDPAKIAALTQAQASPGATLIPGGKGSMNVTSSPLNVKVYLDSRYIGEAPSVFPDIASGTHTIEFSKDGFASLRKNVTINQGKMTNIMVVLEYIPPATSKETSSFPSFVLPALVIALIAIAGGGYYSWNKKMKSEEEEEKDTENESE